MLIREIIAEDTKQLNEWAPALLMVGRLIYWGAMGIAAWQGARAMYDVYSRWHDGELTDEDFKQAVGEEAWTMLRDMLYVQGGMKAAKMSWQAFRSLISAARSRPLPATTFAQDALHGGAAIAGATAADAANTAINGPDSGGRIDFRANQ